MEASEKLNPIIDQTTTKIPDITLASAESLSSSTTTLDQTLTSASSREMETIQGQESLMGGLATGSSGSIKQMSTVFSAITNNMA